MKFSAATLLAIAAGVQAGYNATVTTEVVTAITTYCPAATEITYGGSTYTVTEATTLTITDCPCTVTKSLIPTSSVKTSSYSAKTTGYSNGTYPTTTCSSIATSVGTISGSATKSTSPVATAGAGKAAALSGAGLAGVMGLAAFLL